MTTMKSADGSQYVLVLTKEQAELLGTLRFSHVAGDTPLYSALAGLPNKWGANYRLTNHPASGRPIFNELIPAPRTPEPRIADSIVALDFGDVERRVLAAPVIASAGGGKSMLAELMKTEATLRKERKVWWIVQYEHTEGVWISLVGNGNEANRVYPFRNVAYREMRKRAAKMGVRLDRYRVVPNGTKDGPESDRGYYVIEFFRKLLQPTGWGRSVAGPLGATFPTAEAARFAINTHVDADWRSRYRVKWCPSRS